MEKWGGGYNFQLLQHNHVVGNSSVNITIDLSKSYILTTCLKIRDTYDRMACFSIEKGNVTNLLVSNVSVSVSGTTLTLTNNDQSSYYIEYCIVSLD